MNPAQFNDTIAGWTPIELLGSGSFGEAYKVKDQEGKVAVLKLMRKDAEITAAARFKNESWALGQVSHPGIPQLFSDGEHDGRPYIVMSFAKGRTLKSRLEEDQQRKRHVGEVEWLDILIGLASALKELHSKGICHRDIKHDNVVVSDNLTHVTLIDLGMCKGPSQPIDGGTFWNAGASRFSPPSKLDHPRTENPSHDIFAVGVLSYLMLTHEFPWSARADEDFGHLKEIMTTVAPRPVYELNNTCSLELCDFVASLIGLNDSSRPTVDELLSAAKDLRSRISCMPLHEARAGGQRLALTRILRDPIHGDVRMTELEWTCINTPEFQRLRRIKQLGFSNLVYPGAEHTRFAHSIGALHVTERIIRSIEDNQGIPIHLHDRHMARLYALLHDVTHIPFGHTLEDELGWFSRHDENGNRTARLFFGDSRLGAALRTTDFGRDVLEYFDFSSTLRRKIHLKELVESPHGSDVIDYIDRDAFYCGLDHRVDSAIYRRFKLLDAGAASEGGHLGLRLHGNTGLRIDAEYTFERILWERFSLFMKVYTHPMKFAAGAMLGKAMYQFSGHKKKPFSEELLERMGDDELLVRLGDERNPLAAQLAKRLTNRALYKPVYRARWFANGSGTQDRVDSVKRNLRDERNLLTPEGRAEFEGKIAKNAKISPDDIIVYCPSGPPGLQKIKAWVEETPGSVTQRQSGFAPLLDQLRLRHADLWALYAFVNPDLTRVQREAVATNLEVSIGQKNDLNPSSRYVLNL